MVGLFPVDVAVNYAGVSVGGVRVVTSRGTLRWYPGVVVVGSRLSGADSGTNNCTRSAGVAWVKSCQDDERLVQGGWERTRNRGGGFPLGAKIKRGIVSLRRLRPLAGRQVELGRKGCRPIPSGRWCLYLARARRGNAGRRARAAGQGDRGSIVYWEDPVERARAHTRAEPAAAADGAQVFIRRQGTGGGQFWQIKDASTGNGDWRPGWDGLVCPFHRLPNGVVWSLGRNSTSSDASLYAARSHVFLDLWPLGAVDVMMIAHCLLATLASRQLSLLTEEATRGGSR